MPHRQTDLAAQMHRMRQQQIHAARHRTFGTVFHRHDGELALTTQIAAEHIVDGRAGKALRTGTEEPPRRLLAERARRAQIRHALRRLQRAAGRHDFAPDGAHAGIAQRPSIVLMQLFDHLTFTLGAEHGHVQALLDMADLLRGFGPLVKQRQNLFVEGVDLVTPGAQVILGILAHRISAVAFFKVLQVVHQRLHAFKRHGVVDRGPHAAHRLVPLELQQPRRLGALQESGVQSGITQMKWHIHARAAIAGQAGFVKLRGIERVVQQMRLGDIARFHRGQPFKSIETLALDPLQHQSGDIDRVSGRRVEHGMVGRHHGIVEGAGAMRQGMAQQIAANDDQCQPGGADVLLRAAIDAGVARHLHRTRQQVRGHIGHQRHAAAVGHEVKLHPVDGFVGADVQILRVGADAPGGVVGNAAVALIVVGARAQVHIAVFARFLLAFLRPASGHHIVGLGPAR